MGSDSIPHSDESINRGLVSAHIHSITQTQKILAFTFQTGECWQQNNTQHAPPIKTECDYLNGWIQNGQIHKNLAQSGESRDITGNTEEVSSLLQQSSH